MFYLLLWTQINEKKMITEKEETSMKKIHKQKLQDGL